MRSPLLPTSTMENALAATKDFAASELNILTAVRRHWIIAALTATAVFGGMAFKTLRQPGVYRSESLIAVANRAAVPIVQEETTTKELAESLPTEIEILQSPSLLNRAIAKLAPDYKTIPVWEIQSRLSLTQPKDTNVLAIAYEDPNATRAKAIMDAIVATYVTYSEESRRSPVTTAIKFIEERLPKLESSLNQSSDALTDFRTQHNLDNPEKSVELAYSTKEQLQQSIDMAEIELSQVGATYQAINNEMVGLGQNPNTALPDVVLSQNSNYQALLQQLQAIEVQYKLEATRFTPNHPTMLELQERRDTLKNIVEAQKRELAATHQGSLPPRSQLAPVQQDLATKLMQTRLSFLEKEKGLSGLRQKLIEANLKLQQLLRIQQQYRELNRQYQLNAQNLDGLLSKLQELRIQEAQDIVTWKVIEPPNLPVVPLARSRIRGLVLGAITGALAGILMAWFLERIDARFKTISEIKEATGLPLLGVIPQAQTATAVGLQASDSFTEAIRSLALALTFQNPLLTGKIVAITSAIAGEGKTTITYNLALALAELNKRVLIVDANLAHPTLHEVFGLNNLRGLTTAIATDTHWQQLIQPSYSLSSQNGNGGVEEQTELVAIATNGLAEVQGRNPSSSVFARVSTAPSLAGNGSTPTYPMARYPDILTAGPVSSVSFPWLVSIKMLQLLEQWRKAYDYILIDTSNMTELADAQSLSPKADETIVVVSLKGVEKERVSEALDLLKRGQSKIGGIVVNTTGQNRRKGKDTTYMPFS